MDQGGGSSGRPPSDGEDGRPPFKKAKYAWQIKGRRTTAPASNSNDQGRGISLNRTQAPLDERTTPNSPAHCMVVQCMEQFLSTLTRTNYVLRKWQTKQIGRGIIDNAINKVLEEMGFTPVPAEPNDVTRQNIENEGVSEAIRQQGLQRRTETPWMPGDAPLALGDSVPCTCWLYWKGNRGQPPAEVQASATSNVEDKRKTVVDEAADDPPEDLLDAAVSFAISAKGLNIFTNPE